MKYRATELHREQNYEEILAKTRAEEAAEAAVRAAGEAKQRVDATQDAHGEGPPWLSCEPSRIVHQAC